MFKVAIVEDSIKDFTLLKSYLEQYEKENNIEFNIQCFENGIRFLDKFSANYDIIFMDIDMPYMNGLEVSKKIREIDKTVVLIFVTNLSQYAVNGYEVEALDYIVKPISYFNFSIKSCWAVFIICCSKSLCSVVAIILVVYVVNKK